MDRRSASVAPDQGTFDGIDPKDLKNAALYINRELGWLEFNRRVLAQASDQSHPLLERVKFLGITGANLDEFFMIRLATTMRKIREGIEDHPPDGLDMASQLHAMRRGAYAMLNEQAAVWSSLRRQLTDERIVFLDAHDWTPQIEAHLRTYFSRDVFPVLTPLAFDPGHPFPFVSNLSTSLAVAVQHGGRTKFARVKVPSNLPRFVELPAALSAPGTLSFVFIEDVIKANVHRLFPETVVKAAHLFRIIRDTDLEIDEDDGGDDLMETVESSLKQLRHGALAFLQVESDMPKRTLDILVENFEASDEVVLRTRDRMGFGDWIRMSRHCQAGSEVHAVRGATDVARGRGPGANLRSGPAPGHPAAPSLRVVRLGGDVPPRRRPRSARHRHQDDLVPHRTALAARSAPHRGGRGRQAGGGPCGAEGAVR